MSQRRGRSLDRSRRGTRYKPELLVQHDKNDVAFTAWLTSIEKIVYAGDKCYVLHFNLHFMNGLSDRRRFRCAKFEVEVHSSSRIETPEMMFVRPVSNPGSGHKPGSSSSGNNDERATSTLGRRQTDSHDQHPRSARNVNSTNESSLIQGMVLPPSIARWKISERPKSKDGIPQHVQLQAMVRCRGGFAIEVKNFEVKVGYKDWLWPDRLIRASYRDRDSASATAVGDGIVTENGDEYSLPSAAPSSETIPGHRQTVSGSSSPAESIPRKAPKQSVDYHSTRANRDSLDSMNPQISFPTDTGSDRSSQHANSMFSSFQAWLDSSRNFDQPEKVKLQALQEFMSATYGDQRASSRPRPRSAVIASNRNSNSSEMSTLVGELNSESEVLEAWLRRETLRKKAIETCLDTASWDASSQTRRRASSSIPRESGSQIQVQRPYEATQQRRLEEARYAERPLKAIAATQNDIASEKRYSDTLIPERGSSLPANKLETTMDPLRGEGLRRVWTNSDGIHQAMAANPKKESGILPKRPRVTSQADKDKRWSPMLAWKQLSPAY